MTLGELIKKYRNTNGLTMQDFATRSGLSKGYISMLEKGKHPQNNKPIVPSIDTFGKVAKAMCISLNDLLVMVDDDQLIDLRGEKASAHLYDNFSLGSISLVCDPSTKWNSNKELSASECNMEKASLSINCINEEEYERLSEFITYFRGVSEKAQAQIIERAKVLYEIENEEDVDVEVPEEYSGPNAELVRKIREEDVESTINDLINRGNAELLKRNALDIKNKAK